MSAFNQALDRALANERWALGCPHERLRLSYNCTRRQYQAQCQACGRGVGQTLGKRASTNPMAVHLWLAEIKDELGMDDGEIILGQAELEAAASS